MRSKEEVQAEFQITVENIADIFNKFSTHYAARSKFITDNFSFEETDDEKIRMSDKLNDELDELNFKMQREQRNFSILTIELNKFKSKHKCDTCGKEH